MSTSTLQAPTLRWLSVLEAAQRASVSPDTLRRWVRARFRPTRRSLIDAAQLDSFIRAAAE
jgi:hypothetical protein